MTRTSQLLYPQRDPAAARPAATVLLVRDTPDGLQVLMTRRSATANFVPGAYVFPGGVVDAADAFSHAQSTRRVGQSDERLTQAIAAIRESFEEVGVLLARRTDGSFATQDDIEALDRHHLPARPFAEQCAMRGLTLAGSDVFVLAHWTTDRDLARRFDVPFLIARMPEGQNPVADDGEQFEPVWITPEAALARHEAGYFSMVFPTLRTLERLRDFDTVDAVLAACSSEAPLWSSCPRAGWLTQAGMRQEARFMEHEAPFGELALVSPDGQIVHELSWQTLQPVALLKNVMRLTAPNPGMMTGPGTNTYLVGNARTGYVVIDPGPVDAAHTERLYAATGGNIQAIVCTHSHPDHSPGARPLQALSATSPPIWGLPSGPHARADSHFVPDKVLHDGERLTLRATDPESSESHTLWVVHTPGHAANHLCLVLQEDGLLFSGDHILNGSTTVINPPDGCMTAYLNSLDRLSQACDAYAIGFILPAHGYVIGNASAAVGQLKAHRLRREAKIQSVMNALPGGSLDDWLPLAYDDTPPHLWAVARRSLLAHVERLLEVHSERGAGGKL